MKQPLVQILVIVASIQMRTLKAEVEKGSVRTAIGHGLVDPKALGNSVQKVAGWRRRARAPGVAGCPTRGGSFQTGPAVGRKGNRLIFLYQSQDSRGGGFHRLVLQQCGNANEPRDAGGGPGKSSLFFLTVSNHTKLPWNRVNRR